ncbi:hypothetical protein RDI58_018118 [Solanum bulbocastanum]|uniref:GAG-pre-integrase domain-containing protein n=1 Tax=Solanum bulbocastanum TaxID=147425 RepID=A0AAN8YCN5_SOLBU
MKIEGDESSSHRRRKVPSESLQRHYFEINIKSASTNHTALECRNSFNHSYVPNLLPKSFAAMNLEEVQPSIWYPDFGASAHMTNSPSLLSSSSPYSGSSQVMAGNGNLLSIISTDTSFLPTSSKLLRLNNVLYDKKTKQVLLHCKNNGSLYPVRSTSRRSCHVALSSAVSPSYLWHQHLGHPGECSLTALVRMVFINCNSSSVNSGCNVCHLGKQSKLLSSFS